MSPEKKLVQTSRVKIRWGDMDAFGHVNNIEYFRYMEQARLDWVEALVGQTGPLQDQGPVIVTASCTFLLPLTYPGEVTVHMYVSSPGRSSIETFYELWQDDLKYADGAAKMVWIDQKSKRSTAWSPQLLRAIEASTQSPACHS